VATPPVPVKTPEGLAELGNRQRRLTQRQRTVLLLVDGRRSEAEVRSMAAKAGATDSCFGQLLEMGLIAAATTPTPPVPGQPPIDPNHLATIPIPRPTGLPEDDSVHVDIPLHDVEPPKPAEKAQAVAQLIRLREEAESVLPAARTLQPESVLTDSMLGSDKMSDSVLEAFDALESGGSGDNSLEEARGILLRAVKAEAPLTGSLTIMRLRRARTRGELAELIDEVETRIIKPYRSLAAQQVLRRARHLLDTRTAALPAN
jgi:hypothetical protein